MLTATEANILMLKSKLSEQGLKTLETLFNNIEGQAFNGKNHLYTMKNAIEEYDVYSSYCSLADVDLITKILTYCGYAVHTNEQKNRQYSWIYFDIYW